MKPFISAIEAGDIAITAAEGGIGYWSQIDRYQPSRWTDPQTGENVKVGSKFVFYSIRVLRDDESGYEDDLIEITPKRIQDGYGMALRDGFRFYADEPSEMDAGEADAVIQYGVFGKLVYS